MDALKKSILAFAAAHSEDCAVWSLDTVDYTTVAQVKALWAIARDAMADLPTDAGLCPFVAINDWEQIHDAIATVWRECSHALIHVGACVDDDGDRDGYRVHDTGIVNAIAHYESVVWRDYRGQWRYNWVAPKFEM